MSKRVKRRRSREQWALILQRYSTSGLDTRTFCAREGIGYASFCTWRRKLGQPATENEPVPAGSSSSAMPFIDLGALTPPGAMSSLMPFTVELELGGHVVLRLRRG